MANCESVSYHESLVVIFFRLEERTYMHHGSQGHHDVCDMVGGAEIGTHCYEVFWVR